MKSCVHDREEAESCDKVLSLRPSPDCSIFEKILLRLAEGDSFFFLALYAKFKLGGKYQLVISADSEKSAFIASYFSLLTYPYVVL